MKKSFLINALVVLISLGGASLCTKLLLNDYVSRGKGDDKDIAGVLRESNTRVKRKLGDNLLWDKIESKTKLYWNDSIQTDEKSQAIITLNDGNEIKLGAASLVSLEKDNEKLTLSLKSGALSVNNTTGKPSMLAKIKVNGVELDNTGAKSMTMSFDEKKGKLTAIETGQDGQGKEITVSKEGKVEEKIIPAVLQSPAALFRTWTSKDSYKTVFTWTSKTPSSFLEIAKDKDFKQTILRKEISSKERNTSSLETELEQGSYFWRVRIGKESEGLYSEIRSLEIVQMRTPEPLTPEPKAKTVFRNDFPSIGFSWKASERANKYLLEIAKDAEFKNIVLTEETENTSFKTSKLFEGPVYWRVSAIYADQRQPSSISQFEISKLKDTPPPILLDPSPKFILDYAAFTKNGGIPFKWKSEVNEAYKFVLSDSDTLKNEISTAETAQNETLVKEKLKPGTYYWSVGYKNTDGQWTFKEVRRFEVDVLLPTVDAPKLLTRKSEFDLDSEPVKLQWTSVPGAVAYRLRLIKIDSSGEKVLWDEKLDAIEKSNNTLEDGEYKYSVSTVDQSARESKPVEKTFKVTRSPVLDAPDFEMPEVQ